MMDRRRFLLLVAAAATACALTPPLSDTAGSADALAGLVLDALARNDRDALTRLALNEREFRDHVWPDLPSSRPERHLPFSYVWGDLHQKSELSLSAILQEHGGKRYQLRRAVLGKATQYAHFVVHRDTALEVVDLVGRAATIRVCGSVLNKDGGWKVFSYVVGD
jgi:hypothetical protein